MEVMDMLVMATEVMAMADITEMIISETMATATVFTTDI
jgi:hypothetical protein